MHSSFTGLRLSLELNSIKICEYSASIVFNIIQKDSLEHGLAHVL